MKRYELWIQDYRQNRYMKYLSIEQLNDRLRYLIENLTTLELNGKIGMRNIAVRPWHQLIIKFTHTCEELKLRGGMPQSNFLADSAVPKSMIGMSERLKKINRLAASKKPHLIKFGNSKHLGQRSFKVSLASSFSDPSLNIAQMDDEMKAIFNLNPEEVEATDADGNEIEITGTVDISFNLDRDYYIFCSSDRFDARLFGDFEADSCLFIYDSNKFSEELIEKVAQKVEIEDYAYDSVRYLDPIDPATNGSEPIIEYYKHIKYLYQHEYRHVIIPKQSRYLPKNIFVNLESSEYYSDLIFL